MAESRRRGQPRGERKPREKSSYKDRFTDFQAESVTLWDKIREETPFTYADLDDVIDGYADNHRPAVEGTDRLPLDKVENLLKPNKLNLSRNAKTKLARFYLRAQEVSEEGLTYFAAALSNPNIPRTIKGVHECWQAFLESPIHVVAPRHPLKLGEVGGYISWTDYQTVEELQHYVAQFGITHLPVSHSDLYGSNLYAKTFRDVRTKTNLVLVGGPVVNHLSKLAMEELKPTFKFVERKGPYTKEQFWLYIDGLEPEDVPDDLESDEVRAPIAPEPYDRITHDYAIIVRSYNPFDPSKELLFISGYHGFGTWGAMRGLLSPEFLEKLYATRQIQTDPYFECVVRTRVVDLEPEIPTIIKTRWFKKPRK